jgi:SHS2 domain-containing protein
MRNYETFSTTADMGIRFQGRDFRELYENALRGLNLLLFGANLRQSAGCEAVPFRFHGDGPENVLVNFLAAALFQVYQQKKRVAAVKFIRAGRFSLKAELLVVPSRRLPKIEVKSATYHNLRLVEAGGMMRAAIVFDV